MASRWLGPANTCISKSYVSSSHGSPSRITVTFAAATKNSHSFPTRAPAQYRVSHFVAITCSDPDDSCDLHNDDCRSYAQLVSPSRDPIGFKGSEWGLYDYTSSRPLYRNDPSGRVAIRCSCDGGPVYVNCNVRPSECCTDACGHENAPWIISPTEPSSGSCKISICCRTAVWPLSGSHCHIQFEDSSGQLEGCRGGPSGGGSGGEKAPKPRFCRKCCGGGFGTIVTACGKCDPTSNSPDEVGLCNDLKLAQNNCMWVDLPPWQCPRVKSCIESRMVLIERQCWKYSPLGNNSNSAWRSALQTCLPAGIPMPDPLGFQPGNNSLRGDESARCSYPPFAT